MSSALADVEARTSDHTDPHQVLRRVLLSEPYAFSPAEMDLVRTAGRVVEAWPGTFATVDYELSRAVVRDRRFTVEDSTIFAQRFPEWQDHAASRSFMRELLSINGESHRRLREVMSQAFVPPGSARMQEIVASTVIECMRPAAQALREGLEVRADVLCARIPLLAIGRLLGLPDSMAELMASRSDAFSDVIRCNFMSRRKLLTADTAVREMQEAVREVMARGDLADDGLVTQLLRERSTMPDLLDDEGLLANIILLYSAGYDTTRSLLGHAVETLATDAQILPDLRTNPQRQARFLREIERLHPPIPLTTRLTREGATVLGYTFPAGSHLLLLIDAANRDPKVVTSDDPHGLAYATTPGKSLSFGGGARTCLGLPMARALSEATLRHVVEEWPDVVIVDAPHPAGGTLPSPMVLARARAAGPARPHC